MDSTWIWPEFDFGFDLEKVDAVLPRQYLLQLKQMVRRQVDIDVDVNDIDVDVDMATDHLFELKQILTL